MSNPTGMAVGMNPKKQALKKNAHDAAMLEVRKARRLAIGEQERTVYVDSETPMNRVEELPPVEQEFRCSRCGSLYELPDGNFFKSESKLFLENWGYVHVCIGCVNSYYNELLSSLGSGKEAIRRICQVLDIPFHSELARNAIKDSTGKTTIEKYISLRNGAMQYRKRGKTYVDTMRENGEGIKAEREPATGLSGEQISRWGDGFSPEDCVTLDTIYEQFRQRCAAWDVIQEAHVINACVASLQGKRMASKGDASGAKSFSNILESSVRAAGISFDQSKTTEKTEEAAAWDTFIAQIEKSSPAEIYRIHSLYASPVADDYWERHIARPARNWMTGSEARDPEFSIVGEEDGSSELRRDD
jgi:hypothetical protein